MMQIKENKQMKVSLFIILAILVFERVSSVDVVLAQERQMLTLSGAIETALRDNINLQQSTNFVESSEISVSQAKANFLPNLNLSISGSRQYSNNFDLQSDEVRGQANESFNAGASSSLNLFNGFADVAALKQARLNRVTDQLDHGRLQASITFETITRFLQVVQDSEFIRIQSGNLDAQKQQLGLIEEFYRAGNRSQADVLQQRAEITQTELQFLNAKRNYEVSKYELLQVLGWPASRQIEIVKPDIDKLIVEQPKYNDDNNLARALTLRRDIFAQRKQISAAAQQIRIARAGYYPSISFGFSAGSNYRSLSNQGGFSDQFIDLNPSFSTALSMTLPIFDRFRTHHSVQQARVQLNNAELALKQLELNVGLEIRRAVLDYETAIKQHDVAQAQLEAVQEALMVITERYNVGSATFVELSQIRAQQISAQNDLINAEYNLLLQKMAIHFQRGDLEQVVTNLRL